MPSFSSTLPPLTFVCGVVVSSVVLLVVACSSDGDGTSGFDGGGGGQSSGASSSSSGLFNDGGDLPDVATPTCVSKEAEAVEGKRPIDIIFEIDNSVSMGEEIGEVENQINANFTSIIEGSKTDYRIIMLSKHGSHDGVSPEQKICVKAPLSGTTCSPIPALPVETGRFFHHSVVINSQDTFCQILQTFAAPDLNGQHPQGWAGLLRPGAFKIFTVITDDRPNAKCSGFTFDDKNDDPISATNTANAFDSALLGLSALQFGSTAHRNYAFYSIVGVAPFDPGDTSKPHPPTSPLVVQQCTPGAVAPGLGYQALSKLTGGLRYPTCGLSYTTIFQAMAQDVIGKTALACDYAVPPNPAGGTIDPATAIVRYTSGAGVVTDLQQVANVGACAPNKFYIAQDLIKLCVDSCNVIQADQGAKVKILFGCLPKQEK